MQVLSTYIRRVATVLPAAAGRVLAVLLAAVLAAACVPVPALARTASGLVGIEMTVPAQAYVEPTDDAKAASGLVGVRMEVPAQAFTGAGDDTRAASGVLGMRLELPRQALVDDGDDTRAASGMLGIRLQVPAQAYTDPADDTKSASGLLGIRMELPKQALADDGDSGVKAASGLLGLRMELPAQALEGADPTLATDGLLGLRLKVGTVHTVTFDANGGTGNKTVEVLEGARVSEPDPVVAEREGCKIAGWYTDASCADGLEYDWNLPVLGSFTLYAKWWDGPDYVFEEQPYALHMGCDDAALAGTDKTTGVDAATGTGWQDEATYVGAYKVGMGETLPEPSREGYVFAGWHDNDGLAGDPVPYISKDATGPCAFWAAWEQLPPDPDDEERFTVSFDTRGGTEVAPQFVRPGGFAEEPAAPTRAGHSFDGWYADANCMVPFDFAGTAIEGNTTVYAKWRSGGGETVERHLVSFASNGGSPVATQKVVHGGHAVEPADPERAGWRFLGWYADPALAGEPFDFAGTAIEKDATLYAKWEELAFTVTFVASPGAFEHAGEDGGDAAELSVVVHGIVVPEEDVPAAPKRAGWQFAGWYPEVADGGAGDFAGDAFAFGEDEIDGDVRLWAKWDLRLDVTVPVSVGFAVDADSNEVTTPDGDRYALKSRTVKDVTVDAVAATSEEEELEGFFALPEGETWGPMLQGTTLSLRARDAEPEVSLALAGDGAAAEGGVWKNSRPLGELEREAFTISAFSYGGRSFDEGWRGEDPSSALPVKLGMTVPERLGVRTDLDGPQKITRLTLTVSAKGD